MSGRESLFPSAESPSASSREEGVCPFCGSQCGQETADTQCDIYDAIWRVVDRYGRLWAKDEAYYAAADALGIENQS